MKFYEVRDTTDDELHYPCGFFTDLDALSKEILECKDPTKILCGYPKHEGEMNADIIEWEEGWGEGKVIAQYCWHSIYNYHTCEYEWEREIVGENET